MSGKLTGKVALVTGATTGIGKAIARRFAAEGASVVVNGRQQADGEKVVAAIRESGGEASFALGDVAATGVVRGLIDASVARYGRLDILVNNAYSGKSGGIAELSEEDFDYALTVAVKAAFAGVKYAAPEMMKVGGGSIISLSSVQGLLGSANNVAYATVKGALLNFTRALAVDLGPHNIRVNALCPGRILTERKVEWLDTAPTIERRDKLFYPLRRYGDLDDIAAAALFLASDDAKFITGHALTVDGGLTAQVADMMGMRLWDDFVTEGFMTRRTE